MKRRLARLLARRAAEIEDGGRAEDRNRRTRGDGGYDRKRDRRRRKTQREPFDPRFSSSRSIRLLDVAAVVHGRLRADDRVLEAHRLAHGRRPVATEERRPAVADELPHGGEPVVVERVRVVAQGGCDRPQRRGARHRDRRMDEVPRPAAEARVLGLGRALEGMCQPRGASWCSCRATCPAPFVFGRPMRPIALRAWRDAAKGSRNGSGRSKETAKTDRRVAFVSPLGGLRSDLTWSFGSSDRWRSGRRDARLAWAASSSGRSWPSCFSIATRSSRSTGSSTSSGTVGRPRRQ